MGQKYFNKKLLFSVIIVCIASASQHGFFVGNLNVPDQAIRDWAMEANAVVETTNPKSTPKTYSENDITLWSDTVAMFSAGAVLGSLLTVIVANEFGRLNSIYCSLIVTMVGFLMAASTTLIESLIMLILGRFLIGISAGLCAGVAPMYLAEISPVPVRGAVVTLYQMNIVSYILNAQILGLPLCLGNKYWPIIFLGTSLPTLVSLCALRYLPNSPEYLLISKDDEAKTRASLAWFRNSSDIDEEFAQLQHESNLLREMPHITLNHTFLNATYVLALIIVVSEQLCGISVLIYYSTEIFRNLGFANPDACYATVGMGTTMVGGTMISVSLIDRVGRRKLLLVSLAGLTVITVVMTVALLLCVNKSGPESMKPNWKFVCLVAILLFTFTYGIGVGSAPFLAIVELFDFRARPLAASMTFSVSFLISFIVAQTFLLMEVAVKYYIFVPAAIFDFVFFWVLYFRMPETMGKTSKEVQDIR